ncbi:MAG: hypothetical protein HOQ09_03665, partial [Gemmatimonadaceae bacterium]|nr:hypothetical protein [Gemmatimonadaceae bacterium]
MPHLARPLTAFALLAIAAAPLVAQVPTTPPKPAPAPATAEPAPGTIVGFVFDSTFMRP